MISKIAPRLLIAAGCFALFACAGQVPLDGDDGTPLADHHTTCLKMGLAADTSAHTECVLSLFREQEQRYQRLREASLGRQAPQAGAKLELPEFGTRSSQY